MQRRPGNYGNMYYRLLSTFIALTLFVSGLVSALSYSMFNRLYTDEIVLSLQKNIQYESQRLQSDIMDRAQTLLQDISVNDSYNAPLRELIQENSFGGVNISRAYSALSSMGKLHTEQVASIMIYFPHLNTMLSSNMGYKLLKAPYNQTYCRFFETLPNPEQKYMQWMHLRGGSALPGLQNSSALLLSTAQWQGVNTTRNVLILVALKESYIADTLRFIAGESGAAYLISSTGDVISSAGDTQFTPPDFLQSAQGSSLLDAQFTTLLSPNGDGQLYISAPLKTAGWHLLYTTPIDSYAAASIQVAKITLIVVCIVLLLSLIITLLVARRLYSPVQELMSVVGAMQPVTSTDEYGVIRAAINSLSSRLSDAERLAQINRPIIRNMRTHDLLRGMITCDGADQESLLSAGIELPHAHFTVMIIEWCGQDADALSPEERDMLPFALREQLEESPSDALRISAYLPSRLRIVLLINAENPDDAHVDALARQASAYLSAHHVRSMAACDGWVESLERVSMVYRAAQLLMEFRLMCSGDTLLIGSEQDYAGSAALPEIENRIIGHLCDVRLDDAFACLDQLTRQWRMLPPSVSYRSLIRLNTAIREFLIRQKYLSVHDAPPALLTDPKQVIWTIDEYASPLRSALESLFSKTDSSSLSRNDRLFEKTVLYINEHINEDLSLERISAEMHFNPKYFSRLFKELSGVTLSEFITSRRMQLASQMLVQTGMSIDEIRRMVGYGSTQYFTRKFKEEYQMSPREFRVHHTTENGGAI